MSNEFLTRHGARIATTVAIGGVIAYVAFVFLPRRAELTELRRQTLERKLTATQASHAPREIALAARELLDARQFAGQWSNSAPRPESLISLLRDINQLAQAAQTRNLRLEPAPVEHLAAVWRAPVNVSVEGTFAQLFQLVRGMETLAPAVYFSSLLVERSEGDAQTLRMTATLTIFGPRADFSDYANLAE